MKPENKAFLEEHRGIWDSWRNSQFLRFPSLNVRDRMVQIMREEFRPGYTADLWCSNCVGTMVTDVYREFEKWEEQQKPLGIQVIGSDAVPDNMLVAIGADGQAVAVVIEPATDAPVDPVEPIEPVQVKANFPSHKKHHRR